MNKLDAINCVKVLRSKMSQCKTCNQRFGRETQCNGNLKETGQRLLTAHTLAL